MSLSCCMACRHASGKTRNVCASSINLLIASFVFLFVAVVSECLVYMQCQIGYFVVTDYYSSCLLEL